MKCNICGAQLIDDGPFFLKCPVCYQGYNKSNGWANCIKCDWDWKPRNSDPKKCPNCKTTKWKKKQYINEHISRIPKIMAIILKTHDLKDEDITNEFRKEIFEAAVKINNQNYQE